MFFGDIYTKSETYQKEGWFILEEENQVFGSNAEAVDNNENLKSEDLIFYHQNKEKAKNNVDSSSKDLTDFIDSLIQDVPAPSEQEVDLGIEKVLETAYPAESDVKSMKKKNVKLKVLFIAALLSVLSFSCLYVVGSSHNISIENGFVTFAKDTMKVVFFGESKEECISVDTLLTDLEAHGYKNILFPEEFTNNYDLYRVSLPEYKDDALCEQVSFDVYSEHISYSFLIDKHDSSKKSGNYLDVVHALTLKIDDTYVYIFEFESGFSCAEFFYKDCRYNIGSYTPYSEIMKLVKTFKLR